MIILFDLDDTLIDSESAHLLAFDQMCQEHLEIENNDAQNWITIKNRNLNLFFEGKISLEEHRLNSIIEFCKINDFKISKAEAEKVYQQYHLLLLQSCKSFPDVIPALIELKNHQLGIISNGIYSDQIYKLRQNKLLPFFRKIIVPEDIGFSKPAKEIFFYAAQEFGASLSNCIYIGDSYELDYLGSMNAGMRSILLDRKKIYQNQNGKKIYSLNQLKFAIEL